MGLSQFQGMGAGSGFLSFAFLLRRILLTKEKKFWVLFCKGHSCKLASHLAPWKLGQILSGCIHSRAGE